MDCFGFGSIHNTTGDITLRVNRDPCTITAVDELKGHRLSKKINGDCLFGKCKAYKFKYLGHDVDVDVNSWICPSFTVFIDGEEANTKKPKRQYLMSYFMIMAIAGWLLFGVCAATLVVLITVVDQYMKIWRQVWWILCVLILFGAYFALVGTVCFIRALLLPTRAAAQPPA